ncbi:MAG: ribosomal L7Ae/L30e/S12e/Gadd45 family protein [Oscillospiraceae bacterium]|nr:ribosomal L7Ae/L30e/S12e/Gadd45 family protein [Oscillospiraceae bacterium]
MDTQNYAKNAESAILAGLPRQKIVVGAKQLRKALDSGRVRQVYLARNADPAITEPIEALCRQSRVEYFWIRSMQDLGKACGIEVGAAAAAVVN